MSRSAWRPILPLALTLLLPTRAPAHQGRHPETVRALLKADALHLSVHFSAETPEEARRFRQAHDANADGRLDGQERDRALAALEETLLKNLAARIDRTDLRLQFVRRDALGLVGAVDSGEPLSASFQLRATVQLSAGLHRLRLRARSSAAASDVPVFFQLGRGLTLGEHNATAVPQRADTLRANLDDSHPLLVGFSLPPTG